MQSSEEGLEEIHGVGVDDVMLERCVICKERVSEIIDRQLQVIVQRNFEVPDDFPASISFFRVMSPQGADDSSEVGDSDAEEVGVGVVGD